MVVITGKLNGNVSGKVTFTPDDFFIDQSTTPDTLITLPISADITDGEFSIDVPQTEKLAGEGINTEGITYKIEVKRYVTAYYLKDGTRYSGAFHKHTDDKFYTGLTNSTSSRELDRTDSIILEDVQPPIHAVVPDKTAIEFTELVGITAQKPYLDVTLHRLAQLLVQVDQYRERISSKFNPRGEYNPSAVYNVNDLVNYEGSSYLWTSTNSLAGQTPPTINDQYWFRMGSKGDTGSGTTAAIVGWNPTTWNGSTEAAARGDVEDAISSLSSGGALLSAQDAADTYLTITNGAPRRNPTFTGSVQREPISGTLTNKDTEIPTAAWVENAIGGVGSLKRPDLVLGKTSIQAMTQGSKRGFDTKDFTSPAQSSIDFDTIHRDILNLYNSSEKRYIFRENGDYLFFIKLRIQYANYGASLGNSVYFSGYIRDFQGTSASRVGTFFHVFGPTYNSRNDHFFVEPQGFLYVRNLSAGARLDFHMTGNVTGGHTFNSEDDFSCYISPEPTVNETSSVIFNTLNSVSNQLLMWKVG